jgi:hypothetical protein
MADHKRILRAVRLMLSMLIVGGVALAVALVAGIADPPTAGNLMMDISTAEINIPPNQQIQHRIALERDLYPPYTLVVKAQFVDVSDADAQWGIQVCDKVGHLDCGESGVLVLLTNDAYFNVYPFAPDTSRFVHLRMGGESNEIYLNLDGSGHAIIRLNREIAWEGQFPTTAYPTLINVVGKGGKSQSSNIRLLGGALYTAS